MNKYSRNVVDLQIGWEAYCQFLLQCKMHTQAHILSTSNYCDNMELQSPQIAYESFVTQTRIHHSLWMLFIRYISVASFFFVFIFNVRFCWHLSKWRKKQKIVSEQTHRKNARKIGQRNNIKSQFCRLINVSRRFAMALLFRCH